MLESQIFLSKVLTHSNAMLKQSFTVVIDIMSNMAIYKPNDYNCLTFRVISQGVGDVDIMGGNRGTKHRKKLIQPKCNILAS